MRCLAVAMLALALGVQGAIADDFPQRPVRIIVPYAAGGPSDAGARLVADPLARELGKPVYIENRGGAGGLTGTETFLTGELDGHTILLGGIAPLTIIPAAKKVSYVAERDFVPIGTVWRSAQTLVVRPTMGVKTVADFLGYAKANPGKVTIASAGTGTVSHLAGELLKRETGIDVIHVPYRSTGASLPAVIGGQIDGLFGDAATLAPHVASGSVVVISVAAPQRSPALPDTPTFAEAGYPTVVAEGWHGLVVSVQTPAATVQKLRQALAKAQADPAYQEKLKQQGATAGEFGPEALAKLIRDDTAKWGPIIKAANIQMD